LRKRKVRIWRLVLGALVGTLYLLILFVDLLAPLYSWYGKLLLSALIVWTAFGISRLNLFLIDLLFFYMVSFLVGGGMFAMQFLFQGKMTMLNGILVEDDAYLLPSTSIFVILFGYLLMFYLSRIYFQAIEIGKRRSEFILTFRISMMGERIEGKGLIDTGNQLHEPITRVPVIILQMNQIEPILPNALKELICQGDVAMSDPSLLEKIPHEWQNRIRFVPYRGIGKGNQLMIALTPDEIELSDGHQLYRTERVRIGIKQGDLSADGTFAAILHPELLNEKNMISQKEEVQHAGSTSP